VANYLTFADIRAAVARQIKDPTEQWADLINMVINQVYLTEVIPCDDLDPLYWLIKPYRVRSKAPVNITNITAANPPVITTDGNHYLNTGDVISIFDVSGMVEINLDYAGYADDFYPDILYRVLATPTDTTLVLADLNGDGVDASAWTAYTSGGTIYHHGWAWPVSLMQVLQVGLYDQLPLTKISWEQFMETPDRWVDSSPSTPDAYLHHEMRDAVGTEYSMILTFPGASQDSIAIINATYNVARLSADGDVPILPYQFHDVIVTGCVTRLLENNVQVENAVIWPGLYQVQLEGLRTFNRKWWDEHRESMDQKPYGLLG